jgi:predicted enzyme related to lactoylglutathione lyase
MMVERPSYGRFVWYELMTTDVGGAQAFYAEVMGWNVRDASMPDMAYAVFATGTVFVSGVLAMPELAKKQGAAPRWIGYVAVDDVDAAAARVTQLGGAVQVPPTDIPGISRFSIVTDPQLATFALFKGAQPSEQQHPELGAPGCVSWHELLVDDWDKAFAFYGALFGWHRADAHISPVGTYQQFSVGGQTIGGMFNKPPELTVPAWLYYFSVADIDAAAERVKARGGQLLAGPIEVPGGSWIARCADPQGAVFALEGQRDARAVASPVTRGRWVWWISRR